MEISPLQHHQEMEPKYSAQLLSDLLFRRHLASQKAGPEEEDLICPTLPCPVPADRGLGSSSSFSLVFCHYHTAAFGADVTIPLYRDGKPFLERLRNELNITQPTCDRIKIPGQVLDTLLCPCLPSHRSICDQVGLLRGSGR